MDKIAKQLNSVGLDLNEIKLFLIWYKSKKYTVRQLEDDILSSNSQTHQFFITQLPSKQYAFDILKHTLKQKQDEYVQMEHKINCSLMNCPSLNRIMDALVYYKSLYNNNNKNDIIFNQLIIKYFERKYKYLISDYHHLLCTHLNQSKFTHLQNYDMIHNAVYKHKLQCNLHQCQQYQRYHCDREQLYATAQREQKENDTRHKVTLYQDLMDTIHAYFVHAFDDGSRLTITQLTSMKQTKPDYDHVSGESSIPLKDDNLIKLQRILSTKRENMHKLRGAERMKYNKFNNNHTVSDGVYDAKQEDDSPRISDTNNSNCIGMHYYYWDYYKNKNEEDRMYHPGCTYSDWYIPRKYDTFKQEMLSNKIHCVDISVFNYVLFKANVLLQQSDFIQSIKSSMAPMYGIQEDYKITVDIIMALIFFTDFERLRNAFVRTFKRLTPLESDTQIKARNAEFWWFSKIMLETVECWGTQLIDQKLQVFYTTFNATSSCFSDMELMFCAPTSCTPHLEIATVYSEGIMLELCPRNYSLKLFNCSFVSSFAMEEEILFCGGRKALDIHSMIYVKQNENYRVFVKAIAVFNRLMNDALKPPKSEMFKVANMDYFIVHCLVRHRLKVQGYENTFPQYVNDTFDRCCAAKTSVQMSLMNIMTYYAGFRLVYMSSQCDNLVSFDKMSRLFPNCDEMIVNMTGHVAITSNYLMAMMDNVSGMDDIGVKLSKIELSHIELQCDDKEVEKYRCLFKKNKWNLTIQQSQNQSKLYLVRC
eukprot:959275_1